MNDSIHGERTASEPQDRSSSVAHSIEVPSESIRKWQEIVNLLAEIMHVPSASIMRVDLPHIKVFVSSTSEGNPCEPGALDTGPYCETVMKTGQPLLIPDALENEAWKANPHVKLGMISYLGVPICTIEIIPSLAEGAGKALRDLAYDNVSARLGDGYGG